MTRLIAILACVLALAACGNQADDNNSSKTQNAGGDNATATVDDSSNPAGQSDAADTHSSEKSSGSDNADAKRDDDKDSSDPQSSTGDDGELNDQKDKRSYALGMDIGNSLKQLPVDVDSALLARGVRDVVDGNKTLLSHDEQQSVMQGFVQDMQAKQAEQQEKTQQQAQKQAEQNAAKGRKFLAENKKKDGVKTTDSGLQYKVVKKGDGPSPGANDSVTVHYTGKLIDGTVFDSSRKRGKPVTFRVDQVIPGWTEALQLMKQGAKYKLYIPADLAYGEQGAGPIGPNQTLIFDVELLKVDNKKGGGNDSAAADSGQSTGSDNGGETGNNASDEAGGSGTTTPDSDANTGSGQTGDTQSGQTSPDDSGAAESAPQAPSSDAGATPGGQPQSRVGPGGSNAPAASGSDDNGSGGSTTDGAAGATGELAEPAHGGSADSDGSSQNSADASDSNRSPAQPADEQGN